MLAQTEHKQFLFKGFMKDLVIYFVLIIVFFFAIYKLTQNNLSKTGLRNRKNFKTRFKEKQKNKAEEAQDS